jgi:hypothetical protein
MTMAAYARILGTLGERGYLRGMASVTALRVPAAFEFLDTGDRWALTAPEWQCVFVEPDEYYDLPTRA